jgi:hypothetical protein
LRWRVSQSLDPPYNALLSDFAVSHPEEFMTQDEFWQHIKATRRLDPDEHAERLATRLAKLPADDILAFGAHWEAALAKAYTWKLWGAAYLVNGGCSDDGFEYFRNWLVLQGQAVYDAALNDPDSLAAYLKGDAEVEADGNPAYDAYAAVTGKEDYFDALKQQHPTLAANPALTMDFAFEDDAEMSKRYPKLYAAYLADEVE